TKHRRKARKTEIKSCCCRLIFLSKFCCGNCEECEAVGSGRTRDYFSESALSGRGTVEIANNESWIRMVGYWYTRVFDRSYRIYKGAREENWLKSRLFRRNSCHL